MPTDLFFTRPKKSVILGQGPGVPKPAVIAKITRLPGGYYLLLAKALVRTRHEGSGGSARADFTLQVGGNADKAMTTLWQSSDQGALQPSDTVSLQLAAWIEETAVVAKGGLQRGEPVKLLCTSIRGTLEILEIVITAISVDSITEINEF